MTTATSPLCKLPNDLWPTVISFLPGRDQVSFSYVSRSANQTSKEEGILNGLAYLVKCALQKCCYYSLDMGDSKLRRIGQKELSRRFIAATQETISCISNPGLAQSMESQVLAAQGLWERAQRAIHLIQNQQYKDAALRALAQEQAKRGLWLEARATIAAVSDLRERETALAAFVWEQAKKELWEAGREVACSISRKSLRDKGLLILLKELLAQAAFDQVEATAALLNIDANRAFAQVIISIAAGDWQRAEEYAAQDRGRDSRERKYRLIIEKQISQGVWEEARRMAGKIEEEEKRGRLYVSIVRHQVAQKLWKEAEITIDVLEGEDWSSSRLEIRVDEGKAPVTDLITPQKIQRLYCSIARAYLLATRALAEGAKVGRAQEALERLISSRQTFSLEERRAIAKVAICFELWEAAENMARRFPLREQNEILALMMRSAPRQVAARILRSAPSLKLKEHFLLAYLKS